jgi:predicted enzyme related to lactoylglutathione lyase
MEDMPAGEGVTYTMAKLDGRYVGAIGPQPQQQRDAGAPPVWNSYVTVESADRALEQAQSLGGTVHAPAFDVFEAGRMGVVQDPQGGFFLVWEPKQHPGAGLVNGPGALSWNELATGDPDGAGTFYSDLFGWTLEAMEDPDFPYSVIKNRDDHSNGGIRPLFPGEPMPYWLVYFGSADVPGDLARVGELGGATLSEPMSIGPGQVAVAAEPQGAAFALYGGHFAD